MALSNPAHQLHRILNRFGNEAGINTSMTDAWMAALECNPEDLHECLSTALALVGQIRTRVESQGLAAQHRLINRYEGAWLRPFMPDRGWQSRSDGLVDNDSLLALESLSAIFDSVDPKLVVVNAEQSSTLLKLLGEARQAVLKAGDLPIDLRAVILDRLRDVEWAVEHFNICGASGLQAAVDRLGAEMTRTLKRPSDWRRKVGKALVYGWLIFVSADDVVANVDASQTIVHELSQWVADVQGLHFEDRLQLPAALAAPGTRPSEGHDDVIDVEVIEEDEP